MRCQLRSWKTKQQARLELEHVSQLCLQTLGKLRLTLLCCADAHGRED